MSCLVYIHTFVCMCAYVCDNSYLKPCSNSFLNVTGMLPTLIAFASEDNHRERQKSLLILRNLLFFPAIKPSLITNGKCNSRQCLTSSVASLIACMLQAAAALNHLLL